MLRRLGALHLTPVALSQRVRAVEAEMGATLLRRAGRNVALAEAGFAILDQARALLQQTRDMRDSALSGSLAGELRLKARDKTCTQALRRDGAPRS